MSLAGGEPMPAPDTSRVEVGRCVTCRSWSWGYFIVDLTPFTALVLHCGDEDGVGGPIPPGRDSPQLTAAAAVSVAAVVVVCVLLLTIWR
ncbi:hypothetical protein [Kitasatospora sp. MBT66]|uniref:hypothetical protein n=1 Tax=Kitasatospora TaxID=2063 RepID=UPI0005BA66B4|nr:hypothetical protein [Kitasatospora sp. MBT66]